MGSAQFDYIIVGGGSAGSVLANRLTEDPQARVHRERSWQGGKDENGRDDA